MSQKAEDGLVLRGLVVARKRREVKKDGNTRYCISVFVRWAEGELQADRWTDPSLPSDTPAVGAKVEMQVAVGAYLSHGVAVARLSWGAVEAGGDF
jgi:hypothetical protein